MSEAPVTQSTVTSPKPRTSFLREWSFLFAALAMLGGYLVFSQWQEREAIAEREAERLAGQAQILDENIGRQLDAINRTLAVIRQDVPLWRAQPDGMQRANQRLAAFVGAMPGVRTLIITDREGRVVASNRAELIDREFRQRDYFQAPLRSPNPDTLYLSPPYRTVLGVFAMNVARMIIDAQGRFDGVVVATLDPEEFKVLLRSVRYAPDLWSALAHGEGLLFMMMPERPDLDGANLDQSGSFFRRHRESGQTATVLTGRVLTTGEHRIMAQRTVRPADLHMDRPLVVAVGRDMGTLYQSWHQSARTKAWLFALLALSSGLLLHQLQRRQRIAAREASAAAEALHVKNTELEALNQRLQGQQEQLRTLAMVDGLTGVANRRRFDEQLDAEWRRCRRDRLPLALLMIDIDNFKHYNDSHGHQAGDACLRAVAGTLKGGLGRSHDLVARYGGEEFACLLPEVDMAGARTKAEELRRAVAGDGPADLPSATISVGVAVATPNGDNDPEHLLAAADAALYEAKETGRNRVCAAA